MRKYFVRDGRVFQRHAHHLCAGEFAAFANGIGHFAGFAEANPHFAALVTDDDERAEIEAAPAFDDFGGAVDEDHLLDEFLSLPFGAEFARFSRRPASATAEWASGRTRRLP